MFVRTNTQPYPEPVQSSLHLHTPFNTILPRVLSSPNWSPHVFQMKFCILQSFLHVLCFSIFWTCHPPAVATTTTTSTTTTTILVVLLLLLLLLLLLIIIIIIIIHKSMIYGTHHYFFPAHLCLMFSTAIIKHHQSRCSLLTAALLMIQVFKRCHTVPQGVWFHIF